MGMFRTLTKYARQVVRSEVGTAMVGTTMVLIGFSCLAAIPAVAQRLETPAEHKPAPTDHYYDSLPQETGAAGLKLMLRRLNTTARLMQVDAHPDDEDGGMLTLEARGKGVSALLLTLTRGEGGQNKLGSNLFDGLGLLRTLEVLASDRYYGIEQRFSRVADFGYSKTPEETFQKWQGHDIALGEIVRVVRTFRPDVLVARFSGTDRDGHGHHQVSAILTREAFRAAADPKRFPEQIAEGLQPWQPKKLYIGNVCGFGAMTCDSSNYTVKLNTGTVDPVLGTSYIQFAMQGLRHQQSQGAANWTVDPGDRFTFYKLVDSLVETPQGKDKDKDKDKDGHERDFFDGLDTSITGLAATLGDEEQKVPWLRGELSSLAGEIKHATEKSETDSASASESLWKAEQILDSTIDRLQTSAVSDAGKQTLLAILQTKQHQAEIAANLASGVSLEATVTAPGDRDQSGPGKTLPFKDALTLVSPGQSFQVTAKLHNGSDRALTISGARLEGTQEEQWVRQADAGEMTVAPGQNYYANFALTVPADAPATRPYWHRDNPETDALNTIDDERYRTLPLPPPPLHVRVQYDFVESGRFHSPAPEPIRNRHAKEAHSAGISATVFVPYVDDSGVRNNVRNKMPLAIAPAFSLTLDPGEQVLPDGTAKADGREITVKVGVQSNLTGAPSGTLRLELPQGWKADPERLPVALAKRGDRQEFTFKVLPGILQEGRVDVRAALDAGSRRYNEGYSLVTREDLPSAYYYQPAQQRISIVDVKVPKDLKLGYIMGAGDDIPTVLQQIGIDVTAIPADKLGSEDLGKYQTVVLGIRAYDTQKDVIANNKRLLDYVQAGGRLVVQYNAATGDFNSGKFTPYPATLSRARVSVEEAPVTILDPASPIFHSPNEITQKDFEGWVQERGLYFMSQWDSNFTPLLESHDPGEGEQKGGLLVAHYGKGTYIYTGYAFFRQLPAGVPGAVRLFVNLVSGR
ncbi:MAG TPA: PIG-L family deacetylase [Terriglobales bacterium]|nr:PIG-L family deacetylase [Terriglobales bacterium]